MKKFEQNRSLKNIDISDNLSSKNNDKSSEDSNHSSRVLLKKKNTRLNKALSFFTFGNIIKIISIFIVISIILFLIISYSIMQKKLINIKNNDINYIYQIIKEILGNKNANTSSSLGNNVLYNEIIDEIKKEVKETIKSEIEVKDKVKNELKSELKEYIKENIIDNLKIEIKKEIEIDLKNIIENYMKNNTKKEIEMDFKNEIDNYMKNNTKKEIKQEIEIDLKGEIENEIKKDIITYTNHLFNDNSKNYIKFNDHINAEKLQNKTIGIDPGCVVNIQNNGKINPNIIFTKGMIIAWFGLIEQIPENWVICDGTQGTPDLRNRFIIGSSENISFGQTGGKFNVTLSKDNLPKIGNSYFSCDSHKGSYYQNTNGFIIHQSSYSTDMAKILNVVDRLPGVKNVDPDKWGSNYRIDLDDGFNSSTFDITNPYFSLYYIMKL